MTDPLRPPGESPRGPDDVSDAVLEATSAHHDGEGPPPDGPPEGWRPWAERMGALSTEMAAVGPAPTELVDHQVAIALDALGAAQPRPPVVVATASPVDGPRAPAHVVPIGARRSRARGLLAAAAAVVAVTMGSVVALQTLGTSGDDARDAAGTAAVESDPERAGDDLGAGSSSIDEAYDAAPDPAMSSTAGGGGTDDPGTATDVQRSDGGAVPALGDHPDTASLLSSFADVTTTAEVTTTAAPDPLPSVAVPESSGAVGLEDRSVGCAGLVPLATGSIRGRPVLVVASPTGPAVVDPALCTPVPAG